MQRTLFVATQPQGAVPAAAFSTQPVVQVRSGNAVDTTDNTSIVTAALVAGTGTAGAQLTGTTTATATAGVATFTNLGVDLAGTGYQLRFTANGITQVSSSTFPVVAAGGVIPPDAAPASQVSFAINSQLDARAISRFIYGMNDWNPAARPANLTLSRSGGNRLTAYNWETNASNAGADYFNQNDAYLGGGIVPGAAVTGNLTAVRAANAGMVVTLQTIGYVSADKASADKEDVNVTPNYLSVRFHQSPPRKGSAFALAPDTGDAFVYQDEWVNFLDQTYPGAFASTVNPIMLSLDNEPDLWHHTHARLRGDAVTPVANQMGVNVTYAEIVQRSVDYADAAKDVNPDALVFGPVNYGWQGMIRLQDATDHGNRDFLEFYLAEMAAAEVTAGQRLLDVLDVHWYPEAQGNNAMGAPTRITEANTDPGVADAREQAPRSLWDPGYTETSWIAEFSTNGPIRLLPRLKDKISANYPDTRLAITEYNYGGSMHISGGIAQADVLGIFGREGLFAANLWRLAANNDFIYGGFEMFRDYDGADGSFGDTSIRATNTDTQTTSVYASVDAANPARMVIVCINKADTAQTAGIAITHTVQFGSAEVYTLTDAGSTPEPKPDLPITLTNAFQYNMPANSVTTLVLSP